MEELLEEIKTARTTNGRLALKDWLWRSFGDSLIETEAGGKDALAGNVIQLICDLMRYATDKGLDLDRIMAEVEDYIVNQEAEE